MQQCQYILEKVAPFQRHLSEPNVNGVSRKSPVSCAFLKLDTIRSSCFPKTSSKYLRVQWLSACQVGYRLTENTWPCRTSAEGTHQRKEDSHSQPQQNSTNVSNRTMLCAYFLSISWFKYQNWLSQRRVLGNANSWKISASTPHHLRAEQLSRATYPAHLDTSTAAGTVAKKRTGLRLHRKGVKAIWNAEGTPGYTPKLRAFTVHVPHGSRSRRSKDLFCVWKTRCKPQFWFLIFLLSFMWISWTNLYSRFTH